MQKERMLQFFVYEHLPPRLQEISRPFCELAKWTVERLPQTPERTVCLRKLLEAKDCACRTLIEQENTDREHFEPSKPLEPVMVKEGTAILPS